MNRNQNKIVDQIDRFFSAIAEWTLDFKLLMSLIAVVLVIASAWFASNTRFDNSLDAFFYKDDPVYVNYLNYLDDFESDEIVYIMYEAKEKEYGPFDLDVMKTIAKLTYAIEEEVPFVRQATSLANVEFMRLDSDDNINVDELLINFPKSQNELLKIRDQISAKPHYINYMISQDLRYASVIVDMEHSSTDAIDDIILDPERGPTIDNVYPYVSDTAIKEILSRPEFSEQGITFYLSGDVPMNSTYRDIRFGDMIYITALSLITIMMFGLIFLPFSFSSFIGPMSVVLISSIASIGLIGLLGWEMTQFTSLLPTLLCAVGMAQSIHILYAYHYFSESNNQRRSVAMTLKAVGGSCFLAALTTACGFAVMLISEMKMLSQFGIYSAFGIMLTFVLSVTLMVVFLSRKPKSTLPVKKRRNKAGRLFIDKIIQFTITTINGAPNTILIVSTIIILFSMWGVSQLRVDFNFLHDFKPHVQWRMDTEKIDDNLGGTLRVNYVFDTGVENGVQQIDFVNYLDSIQHFLEQQEFVKFTSSLAVIVKDMHKTFNGNKQEFYTVPDRQDLLSQYFLVYELAGGSNLEEVASHDFSRAVIEVQMKTTYSSDIRILTDKLDKFIQDNPVPDVSIKKTGIGLLWITLADYVSDTQIISYSMVFCMIALIMCLTFGSIKVGLLSMIPNLAPALVALGFLGWINTPLDYIKLILATVSIGIAVDDTIHLFMSFRRNFYLYGNYQTAMQETLNGVGPALIITTIVLISGFSLFVLSDLAVLASFSYLLTIIIGFALITDLFLMPVILMKSQAFGPEFTPSTSS